MPREKIEATPDTPPLSMGPLPLFARTGIGYDSHSFAPGHEMVLGGVTIPATVMLVGHSDGDAVVHAIIDALLGAAAAGDIGEMFPDSDEENRGRESLGMLKLAIDRVHAYGYAVFQLDVTVIAETPALAPHRRAIRETLSDALGVPIGHVSIKAKTNERMGWIGRGEGLACIAVATVVPLP
ncbi:2-C-methyl-D-erythritol 2,4-cyclodiphosphate synthase [soil metagenome]